MSAEENKDQIRRWIEVVDDGIEAVQASIDQFVAPNHVVHYPGGLDLRGHEAFIEHIAVFRNAFPDMRHTIEDMIAEDDKVVIRFTNRGTHKGEFIGIAPTGKEVVYTAISIARIVEGKAVETWAEFDAFGFFQQLGAVPPLGEE